FVAGDPGGAGVPGFLRGGGADAQGVGASDGWGMGAGGGRGAGGGGQRGGRGGRAAADADRAAPAGGSLGAVVRAGTALVSRPAGSRQSGLPHRGCGAPRRTVRGGGAAAGVAGGGAAA